EGWGEGEAHQHVATSTKRGHAAPSPNPLPQDKLGGEGFRAEPRTFRRRCAGAFAFFASHLPHDSCDSIRLPLPRRLFVGGEGCGEGAAHRHVATSTKRGHAAPLPNPLPQDKLGGEGFRAEPRT